MTLPSGFPQMQTPCGWGSALHEFLSVLLSPYIHGAIILSGFLIQLGTPFSVFPFLDLITIDICLQHFASTTYFLKSKRFVTIIVPAFFFFFKLSLWFRDVFHFALTHTVLSLSPCKNIILKCAIWASSKMLFSNGQLSFSCFYLHFLQLIISILFSALLNCPFQPPENMNSWLNSQ